MHKKYTRIGMSVGALAMLFLSRVGAAETSWTNSFFGYWQDEWNWSNGTPTSTVDAKVDGSNALVFLDDPGTQGDARSLSLSNDGSVFINDGTLTIAEGVSMVTGGTIYMSGNTSKVVVGGEVTGGGLFSLDSGSQAQVGSVLLRDSGIGSVIYLEGQGTSFESAGNFVIEAASGEAFVVVRENAVLTVGGGTGTIELKSGVAGAASLQIGGGFLGNARGGTVNAATILGSGPEFSTVSFDILGRNAYYFAPDLKGNLQVVVGGGKTVLTGTNDYTGGTMILIGTLQIGNGGTTGSITGDIENYDKLVFDRSDALTYNGKISESGSLTKNGAGVLTLGGASTYSGSTSVSAGTLQAAAQDVFSRNSAYTVASGAILDLNGFDQSIKSLAGAGNVTLGAGTLTTVGSSSTTFSGVISGQGGLTKKGTGTLTVSGANSYSGWTSVARGTLRAGAAGAFSPNSVHAVSSGATLSLNNFNQTIGGLSGFGAVTLGSATLTVGSAVDTAYGGTISGSGKLSKKGDGELSLTAANTYAGGTVISGGTLATSHDAALGTGAVTLDAGGTLKPSGTLTINSLSWNGGTVASAVVSSLLRVSGNLALSGVGQFDFSSFSGVSVDTEYAILTAANLASFASGDFAGLSNSVFRVDAATNTLYVSFSGTTSGPVLQNNGPYFTLQNANFLVDGNVVTGGPTDDNTVAGLTFQPGSSLTVYNRLFLTNGEVTVDNGQAVLEGPGTLVGPNGFTKLGAGMLNIFTDVLVNGTARIAAGTLAVNGIFTATDIFVQLGAMLKGAGVIFGNVINSGTVAPGNSPGTLTVNGNFTQTSTGALQIELASPGVFDRLVVSGNASLAGTLAVQSFGGFAPAYGQQFNFLQAGTITGTFDTITMPDPSIYRGRFLSQDGTGTLVVAPASYTLVAQTQNQRNVAGALDGFITATSGDRQTVSTALDVQSADQYPAAFNAISPAYYETLTDTTIEQAVAQSQMVAQRLSAVRLGARGFQAIGIEAPLVNDRNGKNVMDAKDGKNFLAPSADNKWGVWALGNGIFSKVTNVSQLPSYRFQNGGFFVGADYSWSEGFTTGVFGGYQGTYAKYSNGSMSSSNSALFGGYATYQRGGFYSDAIVTGGYNGYVAKRAIQFSTINRTARANPDGGQLTSYLDAGYDWTISGFTFGPLVSAQYTYAGIAPFTESGAESLDLRVDQQNANSLRTNVGGRIAYTWNVTDKVSLIPEVRMFWQHEYLQNPTAIGASLDGGAGAAFDYTTSAPGRDSLFAGAGVSAQFGRDWNAFVYYNTDFGRQDYLSQMISTGLGWKF